MCLSVSKTPRNEKRRAHKLNTCWRTPCASTRVKGFLLFLLAACLLFPSCLAQSEYVVTHVTGPTPSPASDTRQSPPTPPPPLQSLTVPEIEMVLSGVNTLSSSAEGTWAQLTIDFIAAEVGRALLEVVPYYEASLGITFGSQRMMDNGRLMLEFGVTMNILVNEYPITQEDANNYVLQAFDSDQEKFAYITALKDSQEFAFMNAIDVQVTIPSDDDTTTPPPTVSPTVSPTVAPTVSPTAPPTVSPTASPTAGEDEETTTAAPQPTVAPTTSTTYDVATTPPTSFFATSSPTTSALVSPPSSSPPPTVPLERFQAQGLIMTLADMEPLNPVDQSIWADETAAFLEREIQQEFLSVQDEVQVSLDVTLQEPPFVGQRRRLQQEQKVTFDAVVSIRSQGTKEHDVNSYITSTFASPEKQSDYIDLLKGTGYAAFQSLESVSLSESSDNTEDSPGAGDSSPPPPSSNNGATIGIAVALVLVGAAIVGFAAYFVYHKRRRGKTQKDRRADSPLSTAVSTNEQAEHLYADEIEVGSRADVSTLGDPIPPGMRYGDVLEGGTMFTAATDALSADYDFQKAFHRSQLSVMDSTVGESEAGLTFPKDSISLDEEYLRRNQFEVEAPAGLLGLVIDSSDEGLPTIRAIKENSKLVGQVQVGDILLSVDDEDVTPMMASTVSRLISSKQQNTVRKFVFTRLEGSA